MEHDDTKERIPHIQTQVKTTYLNVLKAKKDYITLQSIRTRQW
jgi:hypothetical protein